MWLCLRKSAFMNEKTMKKMQATFSVGLRIPLILKLILGDSAGFCFGQICQTWLNEPAFWKVFQNLPPEGRTGKLGKADSRCVSLPFGHPNEMGCFCFFNEKGRYSINKNVWFDWILLWSPLSCCSTTSCCAGLHMWSAWALMRSLSSWRRRWSLQTWWEEDIRPPKKTF